MRTTRCFPTLRSALLPLGITFALLSASDAARASGPVERMVQLLAQQSDPNHVVLRYGLATEGFLYSHDGGRTFRATCSTAIEPRLTRLYSSGVSGTAPALLDAQGRVVFGQLDGVWADDGTGCTWSSEPTLEGKWVASLARDPAKPDELLAIVTTNEKNDNDDLVSASGVLWRRDASGKWSTVAPLLAPKPELYAYAGQLLGTTTASGSRLYASMNATMGPLTSPVSRWSILVSDDSGVTWRDSGELPSSLSGLSLLAVDPLEPKRLLAVRQSNNAGDALLVSDDEGKTFREYATMNGTSGVAFGADGALFVAEVGTNEEGKHGGVWTAPRLGEPLTRVESASETGSTDTWCLGVAPEAGKLRVCRSSSFGLLDIATGEFEKLTSFNDVSALLDCSSAGVDLKDTCEGQLNAGPSWCCTGHYPNSAFCGEYDISKVGNMTVYCGQAARRYDAENLGGSSPDAGTGPSAPRDAGRVSDASASSDGGGPSNMKSDAGVGAGGDDEGDAPAAKSKDDGCTIAHVPGDRPTPLSVLVGFGVLALALGRALRRRKH